MAWVEPGAVGVFKVDVSTTSNGGHSPEFWAKRAVERIIDVSDTAPAPIRDQALAFREKVERVVLLYMQRAIESDRTTVCHLVKEAGHPQLADVLRRP